MNETYVKIAISAFVAGWVFAAFLITLVLCWLSRHKSPAPSTVIRAGTNVYMVDMDQIAEGLHPQLAEALRPKVLIIPFSGRAARRAELDPEKAIVQQ